MGLLAFFVGSAKCLMFRNLYTMRQSLCVRNFGPIGNVDVNFGDLTILIGPQASGKSLFLELFKLVKDKAHIVSTLKKYNYILNKSDINPLLDYYFGESMSQVLSDSTEILFEGEKLNMTSLLQGKNNSEEAVFYVPAQRILSISDGRPKNFMEFDITTPYVLRVFSETLRVFIQGGLGNPDTIFPMRNRLKVNMRDSINNTIFHGGKVVIDQTAGQRKMKLNVGKAKLPFMTWSAGQKEFMPLLLAMYCLSGPPTSVINKDGYKWVVIEEPEMGLHPKAIETVVLQIIELMQNGYKVIVSTHSTILLEFAWAFGILKNLNERTFRKAMCELFSVDTHDSMADLFRDLKEKNVKTYFMSSNGGEGVVSSDISSLDVESDTDFVADWGGLSFFAGKASEIVGKYYQE